MAERFEVYKDVKGEWRWKLIASNGKQIVSGKEGYTSRASCLDGIKSVDKNEISSELFHQLNKNKKRLFLSIVGVVLSLIIVIIASTSIFFKLNNSKDQVINQRLEELNMIKEALPRINEFVVNQESELQKLNILLSSKKKEKESIELLLKTEKEKVYNFLSLINKTNKKREYIKLIFSFFVGFFSSLTATFTWSLFRTKKNRKSVEDMIN